MILLGDITMTNRPSVAATAARLSLAAAIGLGLAATGATAQGLDISGYARFGLQYTEDGTNGWNAGAVAPTSRLRLNLRARAETDAGLRLEVRARGQASNGQTLAFNAPRFTVSGGGLALQLGNISGAFADTPGLDDIIGLTGLSAPDKAARTRGREGWDEYDSRAAGPAGANGVQLSHAAGPLSGALSFTDRNPAAGDPRRRRLGGHVAWSGAGVTLALGFQDSDLPAEDYVLATAAATLGDTRLTLQLADNRGVRKGVVQARHALSAETTLNAFLSHEDGNPAASRQWDGTGGGIGIDHALGGGASFQAGVVRRSDSRVLADAGVIFRF